MTETQEKELLDKVMKLLENIKIFIKNDGGDVNFISLKDGVLVLEVSGHCIGCASFDSTYTFGIKTAMMDTFKEIKDVQFVFPNRNNPKKEDLQ